MSPSRAKRLREYAPLRKMFLGENPWCKVCENLRIEGFIVPGMIQPSVDVHHIRGRVGRLLTAVQFFLPVCRRHHDMIRDNPSWAKAKGYIKDWNKTSDL